MTREAQVWRCPRSEVWPEPTGNAENWDGRGRTKHASVFRAPPGLCEERGHPQAVHREHAESDGKQLSAERAFLG